MESKEFSTAAIATLSTGVLLCPFSDMHEAAEYLMGHPIWTHHFGSKDLSEKMRQAVLWQHPRMPTSLSGITAENYKDHVVAIEEMFGATLVIRKGGGETAMHPLDGIPEGTPAIVLEKKYL